MKKGLIFMGTLILFSLCYVSSQYYFFSTGNSSLGDSTYPYQQGCSEEIQLTVVLSGIDKYRAGGVLLQLDTGAEYKYTGDSENLLATNLFVGSADGFYDWIRDNGQLNNTIIWNNQDPKGYPYLKLQRQSSTVPSSWTQINQGPFGWLKFIPGKDTNTVTFKMLYDESTQYKTYISSSIITDPLNNINKAIQLSKLQEIIQVLQAPCTADSDGPTITIKQVNNADLIGKTKISYLSGIKISFTENGGVTGKDNVPYVFTGDNIWIDNPGYSISNQYGVDKSTINLTVSCTDCKNGLPNSVDITGGTISWNSEGKTWEYKDLNYDGTIDSSKLFDFGIEKEITINGYVYDNPRVAGLSDAGTGKKGSVAANFTFNTPVAPTVSFTYPNSSKKTYINLNENIEMYLDDDWAGVSGDSIVVTLSGIDNEYRGVFSGDDLQKIPAVSLSGANTSGYNVTVLGTVHEIFPTSGTIKIIVSFVDNEGESVDTNKNSFEFSTRPPCSELGGCCNPVEVDIVTGSMNNYSYTYYKSFTGGLLVSGNYQVTSGWAENESGEWIGTGTLICQTSGLSLYSGSEEDKHFLYFTDGEELTISGNNVVAEFSGNQLILRRASEVTLSTIYPTVSAPRSNFDFEWGVTGTGKDSLSGYKIELYSGECGASDPMWSGYFEGSGTTTGAYTGNPLTSLQQYCWKVSAMQGNRVLTGATATFTGMMEIIVKASFGGVEHNRSEGKLLLYTSGGRVEPLYSGIIQLGDSGTGLYNDIMEPGCYDAVFKAWNSLGSVLTGICMTGGDNTYVLNFSNGKYTKSNGDLVLGDMPTGAEISNKKQDGVIGAADYTAIFSPICIGPDGRQRNSEFNEVCDVNRNGSADPGDAARVASNINEVGPYGTTPEVQSEFKGFGSMNYKLIYILD